MFRYLFGFIGLAVMIGNSGPVLAEVPHEMHFQGVLTNQNGELLEGAYNVTISLYDAAEGGALLWIETYPTTLVGGMVDILLGSGGNAISEQILDGGPIWMGVQVGEDSEMTPRQRIGSVPYAVRASVATTAENAPTQGMVEGWIVGAGFVRQEHLADADPVTVPVAWAGLTGIPEGFADGIDDTMTEQTVIDIVDVLGYSVQGHTHGWGELTEVPLGLADGVDDTMTPDEVMAVVAGMGYSEKGHGHSWSEVSDIPEGFADGVDDTMTEQTVLDIVGDMGFSLQGHTHAWGTLTDVPSGFADGVDNNNTYSAYPQGGIFLVDDAYFTLQPCSEGQILKYTASGGWGCASDELGVETGDISGVVAGTGLVGGADTGEATLSVDNAVVQYRVTGNCVNSGISSISSDGSVTCDTDGDLLASLSCSQGNIAKWDGTKWACATDRGPVAYSSVTGGGTNPGSSPGFLAPPATVTVAGGQYVYVSSYKAFGSVAAGGGVSLSFYICYRGVVGGSSIVAVGGGVLGVAVPQNCRVPMGMSSTLTGLPAGTYQVGLCGSSNSPTTWNLNEFGGTDAIVFQP